MIVQGKLGVGAPEDRFEREADQIAAVAMGAAPPRAGLAFSRVPPGAGNTQPVSPEFERAVGRAGGGQPVPSGVRRRMEQAAGVDLGGVRVHVGAESDRLNQEVGSRALTVGANIFVRPGEFRPGTPGGDSLLLHELAHTFQQGAVGAGQEPVAQPLVQRLVGGYRAPLAFRAYRRHARRDEVVREFEGRVGGFHFAEDPATKAIAVEAVRRLKNSLKKLIIRELNRSPTPPQDVDAVAEVRATAAFLRDDVTSAGQIGTGADFDELLRAGNVRELMTAFFNAAYYNSNPLPPDDTGGFEERPGNPDTLKAKLIAGAAAGSDLLDDADLDPAEVRRVTGRLRSRSRYIVSSLSGSKAFARDPFAMGNITALSAWPWFQSITLTASLLSRGRVAEQDVQPRTAGDYAGLEAGLGVLERSFVRQHLRLTGELVGRGPQVTDTRELPWREGSVAYRRITNRWARWVGSSGIPVQTGISATTARMLTAARLLGFDRTELETFLGALIAWMLPGEEHTLFEIQRGAEIAGVRIDDRDPSGSGYTFVDAYRNLPGRRTLGQVRQVAGPSVRQPHESLYREAVDAGMLPEAQTEGVRRKEEVFQYIIGDPDLTVFDAAGPAFDPFSTGPAKEAWEKKRDPYARHAQAVKKWREDNDKNMREFAQVLSLEQRTALAMWSGPLYSLINWATWFGNSRVPGMGMLGRRLFGWRLGRMVRNTALNPKSTDIALPAALEGTAQFKAFKAAKDALKLAENGVILAGTLLSTASRTTGEGEKPDPAKVATLTRDLADRKRERAQATQAMRARWKQFYPVIADKAQALREEVDWHTDMIYDALQHLPAVGTPTSPVYAFRGESGWEASRFRRSMSVQQFLAFSQRWDTASQFAAKRDFKNPVASFLMDNRLLRGWSTGVVVVAKLTGLHGRDISPFSLIQSEKEILIPPGAHLRPVTDPEEVRKARGAVFHADRRIIVVEEY